MLMIIMPNVLYVDLNDNANCSISLQTDMGPKTHQAKKNLKLEMVRCCKTLQYCSNCAKYLTL